jgi:hypothetical protein
LSNVFVPKKNVVPNYTSKNIKVWYFTNMEGRKKSPLLFLWPVGKGIHMAQSSPARIYK